MIQVTQIIVLILYLMVPMVLFGGLQIFLAGRQSRWPGLILPVFSLILSTLMVANLYLSIPKDMLYDAVYGDETIDDVKIRIYANLNEAGEIVQFSDLEVKNRETGEKTWYALDYDENGNLVGGEEAMKLPYKAEISRLGEDGFSGSSVSISQVKRTYIREHLRLFAGPVLISLLMYVPCVVYIVIYRIMRRRTRERFAAKGIEKMMIEDL